ncbi:sce7726 family protein [Heyndrickxia coagulans]|uniref:sce7726 family protein n=1 Tax=Heyndrickxia coagulans TaxID=1398 RepID=UPI0022363F43|nr:sce7726 family protein [Heyndrickxia coagulans]UZH06419.1 sce7726 family protein [Heyndrickxia coagulans]
MLTDFDIRAKLIEKLHKENMNKHYRVIEELAICDGLARADVVVANGVLHGFEIKSDHDSLDRLSNQIACYDKTFDKITIVVGKKFADKIHEYVPKHWGDRSCIYKSFREYFD